jgi:flagella basal body P-ring formation protein FlgA
MKKRSSYTQTRIPLAIALITASFLSAFFLASFSHSTSKYWVAVVDLQSGHQISSGDLELRDLDLRSSSVNYLSKKLDPIGQVLTQNVFSGEIVSTEKISSTAVSYTHLTLPTSP